MSNQPAKGVRLVTGGRYPYYECAFSTFPDGSSERLQTDGQGCLQLDLEALSGTVLTPIIPTGGFWFRVPENE